MGNPFEQAEAEAREHGGEYQRERRKGRPRSLQQYKVLNRLVDAYPGPTVGEVPPVPSETVEPPRNIHRQVANALINRGLVWRTTPDENGECRYFPTMAGRKYIARVRSGREIPYTN